LSGGLPSAAQFFFDMQQKNVKYGIIAGVGTVLYLLLFYYFERESVLNPLVPWSSKIFYIAFMAKAGVDLRKRQDGLLSFKQGLKEAFVVYLVASLIYYAFIYFLFKFIDPGLIELQKKQLLSMGESIENKDLSMTLGKTFFSFTTGLIGGFIFSALVAVILKRE